MSKSFKHVDIGGYVPSTSRTARTDWKLCIICQEVTTESLTCPLQSKRDDRGSGYDSLVANLLQFNELQKLPSTFPLERLDEGQGIEAAMIANKAQFHHTCRLKYNKTKLQRAQKRALAADDGSADSQTELKRTRSQSMSGNAEMKQDICFFCGHPAGHDVLHDAATFQMDKRVRTSATLLGDTALLRRLSGGDMVALDAKYHTKCLVGLYNRARKAKLEGISASGLGQEGAASGIVFAELVLYIEETRQDEETAPVFKLADLARLYKSRMEQLCVIVDNRVHSTRLKERLLAEFPDMHAYNKGEKF